MQARGLVNYYRLKYCWPKVIYCIYQPKKKTGGPSKGPTKNLGGHGPPRPPLRIATGCAFRLGAPRYCWLPLATNSYFSCNFGLSLFM